MHVLQQKLLIVAATMAACIGQAAAAAYPDKPIKLIVPYPAGGGTDVIARMVSEPLSARLGQPIIVENRAGAGGIVGTEAAARAPGDGYTLVIGTSGTIVMGPHLRKLGYDPIKDFEPIGQITRGGLIIVANPSSDITDIASLKTKAAAAPGGLSYATGGVGTGGHIIGESVKFLLKAPLTHISYKGTASATTDVVGGHVPMMIGDTQLTLPHIEAGRLTAVAVAGDKRAECLPNVATLKEQGVDFDLQYWWGLLAPTGTPDSIVEQLNRELNAVLDMPQTKAQLKLFCQGSGASSAQAYRQRIQSDVDKWGELIRSAKISTD